MSRKDDFCVECGRDLECELCSIEDGLVREWVMKARGVARSKGLLSVAGLPAAGRVADVPTPDVEPRAGEPNQPAMTSLPSDPTQEKEYRA
jgi:hypothetical protein